MSNQVKEVLENIISLTSQRDSDALELALLQILIRLSKAKNITIYRAGEINREKYARDNNKQTEEKVIPESMLALLDQCLEDGQTTTATLNEEPLSLFPLMSSKNKPLAVIVFEASQDSRDHELIMLVLKIYHNFLDLMNENERDTLTGLLNRKTFDVKINHVIADLIKDNTAGAGNSYLAIFDIDHFKKVNDTYGHLIGDEVLVLFSRLMDKKFRGNDLSFRFGGEEFVGIFQSASAEDISNILNRFRQEIAEYNFPQVGNITVSAGFTRINADDIAANIIGRADLALYHAKDNGRNQVWSHEELISSGVLEQNEQSTGEVTLF